MNTFAWIIVLLVIIFLIVIFYLFYKKKISLQDTSSTGQANSSNPTNVPLQKYQLSVQNLTIGQPLSPPVFLTHSPNFHLFQVGQLATQGINDISRDGNNQTIVSDNSTNPQVTDISVFTKELYGTRKMAQNKRLASQGSITIMARPGDVLSGAMMISCSNDGFGGIDSATLPATGSIKYDIQGYDSGRELNTEKKGDIPNPCSEAGLINLPGPPSNNRDAEVDRVPPAPIQIHAGIQGVGDLSPTLHGWKGPVAQLTITRLT